MTVQAKSPVVTAGAARRVRHSSETQTAVMVSGLALAMILLVVAVSAPVAGAVACPLGAIGLFLLARRVDPQESSVLSLAFWMSLAATGLAVLALVL